MKYVVEVREPLPDDRERIVRRLAEAFNIAPAKAQNLLRRAPGVVTKPVTEREADVVASLFRRAGLDVVTRPENAPSQAAAAPAPPPSEPEPVQPDTATSEAPEAEPVEAEPVEAGPAVTEAAAAPPTRAAPPEPPAVAAEPATEAEAAPEAAPTAAAAASTPRRRRGSLRGKFLTAGVVPALLTIAFALGAVYLTVRPALRTQLLESARNPAIGIASTVEALLPAGTELGSAQVRDALGRALADARADFEGQNIAFVVVTDDDGRPVAGWSGGGELSGPILTAIAIQSERAAARAYMRANDIGLGDVDPPSRLVDIAGASIEVASQAIERGDAAIGAVVVGITSRAVDERIRTALLTTLGIGLLPVLVGILAAVALTRTLTRNIYRLIRSADQISRGDLGSSVELNSGDELDDLADAIERMRASLQEGLERLRRRRRG